MEMDLMQEMCFDASLPEFLINGSAFPFYCLLRNFHLKAHCIFQLNEKKEFSYFPVEF